MAALQYTHQDATPRSVTEENVWLASRVRELEHRLRLERSRSEGLERGLSALSESIVAMRRGDRAMMRAANGALCRAQLRVLAVLRRAPISYTEVLRPALRVVA